MASAKNEHHEDKFEDILAAVGDYGKYQKRLVIGFLMPASVILSFVMMNQIFMLSVPDHWCFNPDLVKLPLLVNLSRPDLQLLQRPLEASPDGLIAPSKCNMYAINETDLQTTNISNILKIIKNNSDAWSRKPCNHGLTYDNTNYKETASSRYNLVCERDNYPTLVFTLTSVGSAVGTPIFGALSDKYGRKPIFFVTVAIAAATAFLTVAIPIFILFALVRTVNGMILPSIYQLPYLIMLEVVAPNMRARMNGVPCVTWTVGLSLLSLVAYLCADWIIFGWVCFGVVLPLFLYGSFIPESPRWLMARGRFDEASVILLKIAESNGKEIEDLNIIESLKKLSEKENYQKKDGAVSIFQIVKHRRLALSLLFVSFIWTTESMSYIGFYINVSNLYGNEFLNFFLLAAVELPSYLSAWFLMESRLGRRWSNVFFFVLAAAGCFLTLILPKGIRATTTISSLIGKFGTSAAFLVIYQHAAEMFPTVIRASTMSVAASVASLFTISAPYIIYLGIYGSYIPYTIFGCLCLVSAILSTFLPETLNENLPQTLEDGEKFGIGKQFFSLATRQKPNEATSLDRF